VKKPALGGLQMLRARYYWASVSRRGIGSM